MESRNELAELAERLEEYANDASAFAEGPVIRKAQRIIAELAKYGDVTPPFLNMKSVFENCRAIVKEGDGDGKGNQGG